MAVFVGAYLFFVLTFFVFVNENHTEHQPTMSV